MQHVCVLCAACQAFAALPPGGALIAVEVLVDDTRRDNVWGLMMSLDMLMEFGKEHSFDYTFQVRRRSTQSINACSVQRTDQEGRRSTCDCAPPAVAWCIF